MPLLSIILPVYNVAPYLDACLASVVGQDCRDIEVICIDDGSTDGSGSLLEGWKRKDPRVQVYHQENKGLSAARNAGMQVARGTYLAFVDGDDLVCPETYAKTLPLMQQEQLDTLIFSFRTFPGERQPAAGFPVNRVMDYPELFRSSRTIQTDNLLCFSWRFLFKRSVLSGNRLQFDENVKIGEDMIFNVDAVCHSRRILVTGEPLYLYRKDNPDSLMSRKYNPDLVSSYERMYAVKKEQILRYGLQDTAYPLDLARYTILTYLGCFIRNAYHTPGLLHPEDEIRRIHRLPMIRDAFRTVGLRNIGLNQKEYLFFLAQKFRLWSLLLPRYERMYKD